jgi:hypothetical protein
MFCSSRSNRWVPCWFTQVAILYVCDGSGANIQPVSGKIEHDNTPWPLPDGRVIYERWEHVDRSRVAFHHLWIVDPDRSAYMEVPALRSLFFVVLDENDKSTMEVKVCRLKCRHPVRPYLNPPDDDTFSCFLQTISYRTHIPQSLRKAPASA